MPLPPFEFSVDGIGKFVARHETMRDRIAISAAAAETVDHHVEESNFFGLALVLESVVRLVVSYPDGWDPRDIDPDGAGAIDQIRTVYDTMKAEAKKKRGASSAPGVPGGEGDGTDR